MRNRTSGTSPDSFDLLLDTICNVFGGIILMAILVVILTRTTAGRIPTETPEDLERILQGKQLAFECRRLERRVADVRSQEQLLEETYRSVKSPNTAKLLDARQKFLAAIEEAQSRLRVLRDDLSQLRERIARSALAMAATARQTADRIREIERLRNQLRNLPRPVERRVRLPHRRGKIEGGTYYIIEGDKAYAIGSHLWQGGPHVSEDCLVTPLAGIPPRARIEPRAGAGIPVSDARRFDLSFRQSRPQDQSIYFFVCGDSRSFRSFQEAKRIVLERQYRYGVTPYDPEDGLVVEPAAPWLE